MQTFTFDCDVDAQRGVVLRLPSSVLLGRHRLAVIVDPPDAAGARTAGPAITPIDEGVAPRTDLWRRLESLRTQAIDAGELPPPPANAVVNHQRSQPMSSWNNRVLRKAGADADEVSYQIHGVFYDEDGSIQSWTAAPVTVYGETLAELREEIRHFLHACRRPVLEEREVDGRPVLVADDGDDPINPGHYFEFMDRASVATDYVYQFLGSHPLIKKEPSLCALYDKAEAALAELYQEAGRLEFDRTGG